MNMNAQWLWRKTRTVSSIYVKVAEGFGCKAERVTEPEDIAGALQRAKASDMPYVIDIVCERETDGSMGNSIDAVKEHE